MSVADTLAAAADAVRYEPLSLPWLLAVCVLWAVLFAWILGRALEDADASDGDELTL